MVLQKLTVIEKAYLSATLALWAYLIARAVAVPLAHDEIATFFYYIVTGEFLPSLAHWDANNHMLNSALSSVFYEQWGNHPTVIRLANLFFWPLFVLFTLLISRRIGDRWLRIGFLLTLALTHHFIDFFGLSRGYGMSMALIAGGLYYLIRFFESPLTRHLVLMFLFNILALAANLSLYLLTLVMAGLALIRIIQGWMDDKAKWPAREMLAYVILFLFPSVIYALILFQMKDKDLLYYGSGDGIWAVTARSVIRLLSGSASHLWEWFWATVIAATSIAGLWLAAGKRSWLQPANLFLWSFILSVTGTVALHLVLQVNYPEDRVGVWLFLLLVGSAFFTADQLKVPWKGWLALVFAWVPFLFFSQVNLTYSECYRTDLIPRSFYDHVRARSTPGDVAPTIGAYRTRHFCWSYYDYSAGGSQNQVFYQTYPGWETDFLICESTELDQASAHYIPVLDEPINQRYLMERRRPVNKRLVEERASQSTDGAVTEEYWLIYEAFVDSLAGETLQVDFNLPVVSDASPFESRIVLSVHAEDYSELRYDFFELDWLRPDWSEGKGSLHHSLIAPELPDGSFRLRLYLWNINREEVRIGPGTCNLYILGP